MATPSLINPNPLAPYSVVPAPGGFNQSGFASAPVADTFFNGRGVPLLNFDVLDIAPFAVTTNSIAPAVAYATAGAAVPFIAATTQGNTIQTIRGQTAILLDCCRNVSITINAAIAAQVIWTISGLDIYQKPMVEKITSPIAGGGATYYGKKAFWCVFSVTGDVVLAGGKTVAVGCGGHFGLRYRVDSSSYVERLIYGGSQPSIVGYNATIANGAQTVTVTDARITALSKGVATLVTGSANTTVGYSLAITAGQFVLTSLVANTPTNTTADQNYQVLIHNSIGNMVVVADTTSPATATTGDVRGTIVLDETTVYDGTTQLTVQYYVRGANCALNAALTASQQTQLAKADIEGVEQYSG